MIEGLTLVTNGFENDEEAALSTRLPLCWLSICELGVVSFCGGRWNCLIELILRT